MTDSLSRSLIGYKTIPLTHGKAAIVDAADYEFLMQWKWHVANGYARRTQCLGGNKHQSIAMHRLIANTPKGMSTDHINGNRLDNRRANLRICTPQENSMNKGNCSHTSIYKGVGWKNLSNNWQARIRHNNKWMHIGIYSDEIAAAVAYNEKATELFGEFARLNPIPADWQPSKESAPFRIKNVTSCKKALIKGKPPTSKYKGVSKIRQRWKAVIKIDKKLHYLGEFDTQEQAALAYNAKAFEAWGDRAWLNQV